jgi:apolipoprotein N-acyltransferase
MPAAQRGGIARVAAALARLDGRRGAGAATGLGVAATLALPPWYVLPLLALSFTGLVWLLDGAAVAPRPLRRAAAVGFCFGLGYFGVGLHWIAEAFLVDPVRHGWMIPFAIGGLSALLALFPAAACAFAVAARRRFAVGGAGRVLLLAAAWVVAEWLRGWVLTGFPWHLAGYAWSFSPVMTQSAALFGAFGLSLLTVVVAAMPAVLGDPRPGRRDVLAFAAAVLLVPALAIGGSLRLASAPDYAATPAGTPANPALVGGIRLRIVQAGIPQRLKWQPELRRENLMRHIALSRQPAAAEPTLLVWPETAVPYFLAHDPAARAIAAAAAPPGGLLLTGSARYEGPPGDGRRYYNSALAIADDGSVRAVYDKVHLVPFGEYVPLGDLLPLDKLVAGAGDFTAGRRLLTLDLPGVPPVGPLICYEAIFPGSVTASDRRPAWLLNLTNDGWFGAGAGPRQHLAIAAMRAVEEGLPLVRAAGTGISAVIDPYGREAARLGVGEIGILDSGLPQPLAPTPFADYGNLLPGLIILLTISLSFMWIADESANDF